MIDSPYIGCFLYSNILIINELMKFSNLIFMCFWSLFHLVLRLFQPPNQGPDNSETSVAWTFMQLFFRQCFKCAWIHKKITKNVGPHVGPTFFFPLVLGPSFVSAQTFSLEVRYTGARYMKRWFADTHPSALEVSWTKCARHFQRANPNTLVCLYLYINCFVRSNLRMYVLMSEPSSYADGLYHGNKVAAKLQVHVLFVGFDHGLKYRRADDRYRKVTLEDVSHGCHSLPTSHPRYVEPTTPETGVSWCIRPAFIVRGKSGIQVSCIRRFLQRMMLCIFVLRKILR